MLFGISLGGSKSDSDQISGSKSKSDIAKTTTSSQTKTGSEITTGEQKQTTSQLDAETQEVLTNLIKEVGGQVGSTSEDLNLFADQLITRGNETEGVLTSNIQSILAESRRSGEKEIGQLQTQLGTAAGSTQNTFVAGATAEAVAELESRLAAQEGELNIAARQAGSQDLLSAFGALAQVPGAQGQETANVANLVNALKGATSTSTTTQAQDVTSNEQLTALEDILQKITTKSSGFGSTSSSSKEAGFNLKI